MSTSTRLDLSAMSDCEVIAELNRIYFNCIDRLDTYAFTANEAADGDPAGLVAIDMGILLHSKLKTLTTAFRVGSSDALIDDPESEAGVWYIGIDDCERRLKRLAFGVKEPIDA